MTWGMVCVCVVLLAVVGFAIYQTFFAKGKKGSSCGCDCAHCNGACGGCGSSGGDVPSKKGRKTSVTKK